MGDVLHYLIDGTSGLAPGGVDGKSIVAGVCSKGTVGKGYLIGKRSDLGAMLGTGPLVDRVRDMVATGGQEPVIVAVPVRGQPGGYISAPAVTGGKVTPRVSGVAARNADVAVKVTAAGGIGAANVHVSLDGGDTWGSEQALTSQLVLGEGQNATGATLVFDPDDELDLDAEFRVTVRCAVGPVARVGDAASPLIQVAPLSGPNAFENVLAGAELVLRVVKGGGLNAGTCQLSLDGGDNFGPARTLPVDGVIELEDYGVALTFPAGEYAAGTTYTCRILPPTPSIMDVMDALESPLNLYDVEFVYVVGDSDSVDWAAAQAKAEALWDLKRPTYFKMESRLPRDNEDLNDFTAYLKAERQGIAARFVTVCCQFGEIVDSTGASHLRNAAALQAGRVMSIPVQRAAGRVLDSAVTQLTLPEGWDAVQPELESAGYVTAKKYAGLNGVYWGDSRTLADDTSDYRYEEVLRTVFKAIRLMRIAALKSMYDEAGDPLRPGSQGGLAYLKASLENALDTMVKAMPPELAGYVVDIPGGQDVVNNGVAVDCSLIGIPIIRQIKLFARYIYAGSKFDPRQER